MNNYYLFAFLISFFNLLLCIYALKKEIVLCSVAMLYWLSVLYVSCVPLFLDNFICMIGMGNNWSDFLNSFEENYTFSFEPSLMIKVSLYVFLFNLVFYFVSRIRFSYMINNGYKNNDKPYFFIYKTLTFFSIVFCIFFFFFGQISFYSIFLPLISIGFYLSLVRRSFMWSVAMAAPFFLIAFLTTERPHIVPILSCLVMFFLCQYSKLSIKKLLKIAVVCLLLVAVFTSVRLGREGAISYSDVFLSMAYPISRDYSTSTMYYAFSVSPALPGFGDFNGFKFLLKTGFVPAVIWGERDFGTADLPHFLARNRFSWESGTIHPTIYGWAFYDMGWFGLLFAAFVGLICGFSSWWSKGKIERRALVYSTVSIFLLVSIRGSVQVGYAKMFYSFVLGCVLVVLHELVRKSFRRGEI